MKKLCVSLFAGLLTLNAIADDGDFRTTDEILYAAPDNTECATAVFANALAAGAGDVSEYDDEQTVQQWIYNVFAKPNILNAVLKCPELQSIADDDSIRFMPIQYNFPGGRQIIINYETQPKILKQRINLASKRSVETLNDPNPKIGALDDDSVWTNTDPAWYAIMVVQHGALDEFVGADKNNTISLKYINDNIDKLYPRGAMCTSKSALARDDKIINVATHETFGVPDDTNDYYVAGDVSLHWISYAEIGLDVVLTVATMGGGVVITGITKSARASKTLKNLSKVIKELRELPKVQEYIVKASKLTRAENKLGRIRDAQRLEKELAAINKTRNPAKYAEKLKELDHAKDRLKEVDNITDLSKYGKEEITAMERDAQRLEKELAAINKTRNPAKYAEKLKELDHAKDRLKEVDNITDLSKYGKEEITAMEKSIAEMQKETQELIKADNDVAKYAESAKSYREIEKYAQSYRLLKTKRAGNVATRAWRDFRATRTGNKTIGRGARIARQSMKSGRVRDWLFQSTMRNIGALGRLETAGGALYGALTIIGGMYDWTETSTGNFTNDIDFKPLLLLSADDLAGQENVINYGMWLMWSGDSISAADDDAAYLQAFDFADKFHIDLLETMESKDNYACDVDIYVVRPVLRNPGGENPEIYYLIMNDEPWSTEKEN